MQETDPTPTNLSEEEPTDSSVDAEEQKAEPAAPSAPSPLLWLVLVLVAFVLGLGSGYMIWAKPLNERLAAAEQKASAAEQKVAAAEKTASAGQQQGAEVTVPEQVKRYDVPVADSPIYGNDKAPITIIEFSDYECPFCKQWHQTVWPSIKEKYGDKVRLVYRDFPLYTIHPHAIAAAEAAACAGEQNKYFEFSDLLFGGDLPLSLETYQAYAKQVGINVDTFNQCVNDRKFQKKVEDNVSYASELGVRSTPTFFINGLAVVGAQPFEVFQQIIDLELAGKIPK